MTKLALTPSADSGIGEVEGIAGDRMGYEMPRERGMGVDERGEVVTSAVAVARVESVRRSGKRCGA